MLLFCGSFIKVENVFGFLLLSCILLPIVISEHHEGGIWFKKEPSDVVVSVGGSAVLLCEAAGPGPQKPTISWRTAQDEPVSEMSNPNRWVSNGSLRVSQMTEDEAFRCVASLDSIGKIVSRVATVAVARLSEIEGPQSLHVYPRQTAHFTCHATGKPPPKVTWFKDDQPIIPDPSRMVILPSGSLEIDEVQSSDTGSYRCNVTSLDIVRSSGKAYLTVSQDIEGASRAMAPEFIATPRSTVATEGANITLDCAANGNPRPTISWLKDGVSIDMAYLDSRYRIVGTGSLEISNIIEADNGNYQCRAGNREDSVDHQASLHVQVAPKFTKKPYSLTAIVKSDIELECQVYAKPEPTVSWLKNGDPISQKNDYMQIVNGNNLRILGVFSLDYGIFQCVASNPAGNIQAAALLSIKQPEGEVTIPPVETNGRSETGAPRQLEAVQVQPRLVSLRWKPPLTSHGEILSYSVFYSEETSMRERVVNTSRTRLEEANIAGLKPNTTYTFRVAALSRAGLGDTSIPLSVITNPELSVPDPPRSLAAVPTTTSVMVSWLPPLVANGVIKFYRLYYYEYETSEEHHIDTTETGYTVSGLKKFTEYIVWVIAHNENGAGASSEELTIRTLSDLPSGAPTNITLETVSSTSVIVRWDRPPKEDCNGVITGYKLRYRARDRRGKSETVTTGGNRRNYLLENLEKNTVYQARLWAMTVNGTGPPTEWYTFETYENNLDESSVPGAPTSIRVKAGADSINVMWSPPKDTNILVRYYTISWGKGAPGGKTEKVDGKQRYFVIKNLDANSDYVISIEAQNDMGNGPPIYENVRTKDETSEAESLLQLIPPVGLKTSVLSPTTIVLFWTDTMLGLRQEITDQRYYVVRYNQYQSDSNSLVRYRYHNSTALNYLIEDLKPFTTYEFTVKVVKGKKESAWSMVAINTTKEAAPASPPRELTVTNEEPGSVALSWLPPKLPNGVISSYIVSYTTDLLNKENNWIMEMVKGDKLSTTIKSLAHSTTYYFHVKAKNSMGYSSTPVVSITTLSAHSGSSDKGLKGKLGSSGMMYIIMICSSVVVTLLAVGIIFFCCRKPTRQNTPERNKKGYKAGTSGIKPPDLWIHHDQMELKNVEKNQDSGGGGTGSGGSLPRESSSLAEKHHPQYMSSQCEPLLGPDERTSTLRRTYKHKPITLPIDNSHFREPVATATPIGSSGQTPAIEARPMYPRTQYSISRAHVTIDPNVPESPYAVQSTSGGGSSSIPYEPAPTPVIYSSGAASSGAGASTSAGDGKRGGSHPLKSFSVPAPPASAPTTPQQRHVVTVRPQGSSPYKKGGSYSTTSPLPRQRQEQELPKIQASYSTEELNQEMANLEGLMKDLNAITASQFQC